MSKCTLCGTENSPETRFCKHCGSPLPKKPEKVSQAIDDISEEKTVMLDAKTLQERIQEELHAHPPKAEKMAEPGKPAAHPQGHPGHVKPSSPPSPPAHTSVPPPAAPALPAQAAAPPPQSHPQKREPSSAEASNRFLLILVLIAVILFAIYMGYLFTQTSMFE